MFIEVCLLSLVPDQKSFDKFRIRKSLVRQGIPGKFTCQN